jgi:hypothetical protein
VTPFAVTVPAGLAAGDSLDVVVPAGLRAAAGPAEVRIAVPPRLGPGRAVRLNLVTARLP